LQEKTTTQSKVYTNDA